MPPLSPFGAPPGASPRLGFVATLVWVGDSPLATDATWLVRHGERTVRAHFAEIARADEAAVEGAGVSLAPMRARIRLHAPLHVSEHDGRNEARSFVVIDEATQCTVACGTIDTSDIAWPPVGPAVDRAPLARLDFVPDS